MSGFPKVEWCREWVDHDRCKDRAAAILWGKLLPAEALGPRCERHAYDHLGRTVADAVQQCWAIYDLRPVNALHDGDAT